MAENVRARDLMRTEFSTIRNDQSLAEAMQQLVGLQTKVTIPNALIVVDREGRYAGILTARLLTRSLLALWMPEKSVREDAARHERELLEAVQDRLQVPVRDALVRGIPPIAPDARLLTIIAAGAETRLEFMPVVDAGVAVGVLPVTAVFEAAANLALTPEDEGIRFDQ
jgi:predicted transcriptional regulator